MPSPIAFSLRLLCIALAISWAALFSAEPASPLLGSNRDQVVSKLGEPRSQLAVGNRLVMLYARERIVLRDGVVVEVERIAAEPVRRPPPVVAPAAAPATTAAVPAAATTGTESPAGTAVPAAAAGGAVAVAAAPVPAATVTAAPAVAPAVAEAAPVAKVDPAPPPPPEPKLEIKLVRPPSSGTASAPPVRGISRGAAEQAAPAPSRASASSTSTKVVSVPPATAPAPAVATKEAAPAPVAVTPTVVPASTVAPAPAPSPAPATTGPAAPAKPVASADPVVETAAKAEEAEAEGKAKAAAEKAAVAAAEKKAKLIKASRRRLEAVVDDATPVPATSGISTRTYVLAFVTVVGGAALLFWRIRQRNLELAATRVSQTPFGTGIASSDAGGAQFSAEFLGKLEWKRFEELVEAYYSKTGVVATRTKGGPLTAAQVKIAWKGEPRPFALVRCISHPQDLIEVKPLQELYTLLAAEDIRRGYVVTTGKFSVPARDYAEEKHLTLLPGEIFLEKLNALPGPARTEIMNAAAAGDCSTPSCPTCEAKMAKSADVPPVWRCASHPDVSLPT